MGTLERRAFVTGLYGELQDQLNHYMHQLEQLFQLQARVEMNERAVKATRDHLLVAIDEAEGDLPENWQELLHRVRFLGVRLADACLEVLRERGQLTTDELLAELNDGQFRFRTPSPLREINAAMMRQRNVHREGDCWTYQPSQSAGKADKQAPHVA